MIKYILLLLSVHSYCQKREFTFAPGSDTLSYHYIQKNNLKYGHEPIEDDNGDYSFRFSYNYTAITVYKLDSLSFGDIRIGIFGLDEVAPDDTFTMTFSLKPQQAIAILKLIQETHIDSIPDDDKVPGWQHGYDGITYSIESKHNSLYSLKNYWTPRAQRDLPEAIIVEEFKTRIWQIIGMEALYQTFEKLIPFRSYSYGDGILISRAYTLEEQRKHERKKKHLRK